MEWIVSINFPLSFQFSLLMAESIIVLSNDNILTFLHPSIQKTAREHHWLIQILAAICNLVGFVTIIVNKNNGGRRHFVSYHAIIGLVATILCFVTCANGFVTLYATKFKNLIKPSYNKLIHIVIGILTFVFGVISEATGLELLRNESVSIATIVLLVVASFVVFEGSVKTACSRVKRLSS
jgi:cytochrome b-561 domain-containing protein 2